MKLTFCAKQKSTKTKHTWSVSWIQNEYGCCSCIKNQIDTNVSTERKTEQMNSIGFTWHISIFDFITRSPILDGRSSYHIARANLFETTTDTLCYITLDMYLRAWKIKREIVVHFSFYTIKWKLKQLQNKALSSLPSGNLNMDLKVAVACVRSGFTSNLVIICGSTGQLQSIFENFKRNY